MEKSKPTPPRKPKCKICYDKGYFTQAQTFGRRVKVVNISCTHPKRKKGIPCNCECHSAYKGVPHRKLCCKNAFLPPKPIPRICEHEEKHIENILNRTDGKSKTRVRDIVYSDQIAYVITRYLNTHVCKKCNKK